jgi:hypothetical protein
MRVLIHLVLHSPPHAPIVGVSVEGPGGLMQLQSGTDSRVWEFAEQLATTLGCPIEDEVPHIKATVERWESSGRGPKRTLAEQVMPSLIETAKRITRP